MKKLVDLETGDEVRVEYNWKGNCYLYPTGKRYEVRKGYAYVEEKHYGVSSTPSQFDTHHATVLLEKIEETKVEEKKEEEWREVTKGKSHECCGESYASFCHRQGKPFEAKLLIRDLPQPRPEIRVGDEVEYFNTFSGKVWRWLVCQAPCSIGRFEFVRVGNPVVNSWCTDFFFADKTAKLYRDGKLIWSGE